MWIWISLAKQLFGVFDRRRSRWVEISVERAWSHDMAPMLFDLSE
jgi:hypothetical protein